MLVRICYDPGYAFQFCNFLWRSLRIAPGDKNLCPWIFPVYPADGSARIRVGRSSDGAGIRENLTGYDRRCGLRQTSCGELLLNGSAISLSGATTKILHKKIGHRGNYSQNLSTAKGAKGAKEDQDL